MADQLSSQGSQASSAWACAFVAAIAGLIGSMASAAPAQLGKATPQVQKSTYMFGLRCYVANAVAASDERYNGDGSRSAQFKANGEKAFNVIWTMGRAIGNSDALIEEDIDSYQNLYRDTFLRDDAFFQRTRYECGRVGLM